MRRTAIRPARIHELAREFLGTIYDDALVLTIACVQNLHQFSYREALEFCGDLLSAVPVLSTYHYRLKKVSSGIGQKFIEFLSEKITEKAPRTGRFFIVDGTGFSFHDAYPMKLHLGTNIRKIRSHVKIAALAGVFGKHRFAISASAGRPYASELRLSIPLVK